VKEVGTSACSSEPSSTQLPTISAPKTSTKRCLVCHKKTSLATSFHCRWLKMSYMLLLLLLL